jgi:uncharacterized protein involved in type VI secretion and phage assembly
MTIHNGVYSAIVVDNIDPDNLGRVKVRVPQALAADASGAEHWARIATVMAGGHRGTWFVPDVKDEVLVAFEAGDATRPYVLGALWNAADPPPATMLPGNDRKLLRSRNGLTITLDDQDGRESVAIETPGGQKLTLQDGPGSIVLADANGNSVEVDLHGVTIKSSSTVTVRANVVEIHADVVDVSATIAKFGGVVQCDTLVSNSVVSQSYTPGVGNIW